MLSEDSVTIPVTHSIESVSQDTRSSGTETRMEGWSKSGRRRIQNRIAQRNSRKYRKERIEELESAAQKACEPRSQAMPRHTRSTTVSGSDARKEKSGRKEGLYEFILEIPQQNTSCAEVGSLPELAFQRHYDQPMSPISAKSKTPRKTNAQQLSQDFMSDVEDPQDLLQMLGSQAAFPGQHTDPVLPTVSPTEDITLNSAASITGITIPTEMSSQLGAELYQDYSSFLTWNNNVEPAGNWATREPGGGRIIGQNEAYSVPESSKLGFAQIPNSITQSTEPASQKKMLTRQHQYQNSNTPSTDSNGATVLHLAVQSGHLSILRLLLETSLDIDSKNEEGQSALHLATLRGNRDTIQLLLEHGANTDLVDIRGQTALHLAAEKGDTALIRLLIESTSPDSRDFLGRTAFHLAVHKGHEEVVRLMLGRGADIHAKVR